MRVVTWNMGCAPTASPYRKSHGEAWDYLLNKIRPDVALVQEALVTKMHDARRDLSVMRDDHGRCNHHDPDERQDEVGDKNRP
jgi:hypothetical protein